MALNDVSIVELAIVNQYVKEIAYFESTTEYNGMEGVITRLRKVRKHILQASVE